MLRRAQEVKGCVFVDWRFKMSSFGKYRVSRLVAVTRLGKVGDFHDTMLDT